MIDLEILMNLLNDTLQKKNRVLRKISGIKISQLYKVLILGGGIVFCVWYFEGSLSAQADSPIAANSVTQKIEINGSGPVSETKNNNKESVGLKSDMPTHLMEITPLQESTKTKTVQNITQTAKKHLDEVSLPLTKKAIDNTSQSEQKLHQKARKAKSAPLTISQENLFFQKALRYHRYGKLNQAIQMYQHVLEVDPDYRDAIFNIASVYIQLAAYSEAYPLLKKLRNYDVENPDVLINLAIVEIGLGKPTDAIHLLDTARQIHEEPKFEIYFHRAIALSQLGKLEEARNSFLKAEELNPGNPPLIFNLALLYDKLRKYDDAVNYYQTFLRQSDTLSRSEKKAIEARIRSLRAYLAVKQD